MGFKNMKRDDHGHVISNDETDGQKCQHQGGGSKKYSHAEMEQKYGKDFENNSKEFNQMDYKYNPDDDTYEERAFDDDYEEEFKEPSPEDEKQYVDKVMADIADASDKNAFEYVSDNIDKLTEAGLISDETSDRLMDALNRKIDEVNNDDEDLIKAINAADDDVLDEQFGKDTPERKLVGAMKGKDDRWGDNLDLNDRKTRETLVNDYDEYRASKNGSQDEGARINSVRGTGVYDANKDKVGSVYENALGARFTRSTDTKDGTNQIEYNDDGDTRVYAMPPETYKKHIVGNGYKLVEDDLDTPEEFSKKTAKMPNGKEMSLFDFAHNIVNYLDNDTAAYIIASKYGVSENDAKAYLESPYNKEGSKKDYNRKLAISNNTKVKKKKDGTYEINGQTFPDEKSLIEVYGEEIKKHIVPED